MKMKRCSNVRRKWKLIGSRNCHPWGWWGTGKWWKRALSRSIRQYDRAFSREILLAVDPEDAEPYPGADRTISHMRSVVDWKNW